MNSRSPLIATAAALGALAFAGSASAATTSIVNSNAINPNDHVSGASNPGIDGHNYPSPIGVHGVAGSITNVKVTLADVSSTFPDDIDVLLVAPDGSSTVLMSDAGGNDDLQGADLTFDDAAAAALPDVGAIPSGSYRPTNFAATDEFPEFPAASGDTLSQFNGHDPNGAWRLLVVDDASGDLLSVGGGWRLTLSTTTGAIVRSRTKIAATDRGLETNPPALANPYPSDLPVAGVPGTIEKLTVTLHRVVAQHPEDADVLLVAPDGRAIPLLSDAFNNPIDGPITFDDSARFLAPKQQGLHESTYGPADFSSNQSNEQGGDVYPAPAPVPPYQAALADFRGMSPNGRWRLFLTDDHGDAVGVEVENGWSLNFTTKVPPPAPKPQPKPQPQPQPTPKPQPAKPLLTSLSLKAKKFTAKKGTTVTYGLSVNAQVRFRVQRRTASRKFKTLRGAIEKPGVAGPNKLKLRGKIGGKRLKPGSYRLKASVAGGNSRKVGFRIAKPAI